MGTSETIRGKAGRQEIGFTGERSSLHKSYLPPLAFILQRIK
jgi:hypothetical protein